MLTMFFEGSFALCTFTGMGFKDDQPVPEVFFPSFRRPSLGAVIGTSSGAWERRRGRNCPARQHLQNCAQLSRAWGKGESNGGVISQRGMQSQLCIIFQKCGKWLLKIFDFFLN